MTIRELEILKAALESDIGYQLVSHQRNKPEFKAWLDDSRSLLKKISKKLSDEKAKRAIREEFAKR